MKKKVSKVAFTSLVVMNQFSNTPFIYASQKNPVIENQNTLDNQEKKVIYLANGEGNLNIGDGSKDNPYQNIRRALQEVEDGGTIKILGWVSYTHYEVHPTTKAALPLMIDKNIMIEGEGDNAKLYTRAPIQLGADVTLKNIQLEMPNSNSLMPGVPEAPPTPADEGIFKSGRTIYVAGNTLTLDNVNTRLGTSMDQLDDRPFISGGSFWANKMSGNKSVVNIKNANEQTRFLGIYAGDYWKETNVPFELNLDESTTNALLVDYQLHTGGIINDYKGDVTINLGGATSKLTLDNTKHLGEVDVNITSQKYLDNLSLGQVRNLTLSNHAHLNLSSTESFKVENLSVLDDAIVDFRKLKTNPKITGNLVGEKDNQVENLGAIYLNSTQTLEVTGEANGVFRLNNHERIPTYQILSKNHPYMIANKASTAELIINPANGQEDLGLRVTTSNIENDQMIWSIIGEKSQVFKDFYFDISEDQLIDPILYEDFIFPVKYINEFNEVYIPDDLNEFKLTLQKSDGSIITLDDNDEEIFFDLTLEGDVLLSFNGIGDGSSVESNFYEGDLVFRLEHPSSGKLIVKTVTVLRNTASNTISSLKGDVRLEGAPRVGGKLTAMTDNLPTDVKGLKYKWLVDGQPILDGEMNTFELMEEHIGKLITVEVRATNYFGKLQSSGLTVLTNQLSGQVKIDGNPMLGEIVSANISSLPTDLEGVTYQWYLNGDKIKGEIAPTLLLKPEYYGKNITVEVCAANYKGRIMSSKIIPSKKVISGNVIIEGNPQVGQVLTANIQGEVAVVGELKYQWYLDDTVIEGATQSTLEVISDYNGKQIKVVVGSPNYLGTLSSSTVTIVEDEFESPEQPGTPEEPEQPSEPENPDQSETPEEPEQPSEPENPGQPETPEEPEQPSEPENPGQPETPEEPEHPSEPENPGQPETPEELEQKPITGYTSYVGYLGLSVMMLGKKLLRKNK